MVDYEFYIQDNNRFVIPDLDVDLLYSPTESSIPEIAETSESTVKIAGRDGDLVLNTTYEPLNFVLVVYTDENLEPKEKIEEINKITTFLHSIKKKKKKIAFLQEEKMYDVKYTKQLTTTKFPKSVRFEIPLKSESSYGMDLFKKKIIGAGKKISSTVEKTGCIITIEGPCNIPTISLNDYQMIYNNVVLQGNKLVINTANSTIKHITSLGVVTNAAIYYNHEYPKIVQGKNEIKILSGVTNEEQITTEWYDLKF